MSTRLRIGVPTNGRVHDEVMAILIRSDYRVKREQRKFFFRVDDDEFVFARISEIVRMVALGKLDCGFVTADYFQEMALLNDSYYDYGFCKEFISPSVRKEFPQVSTSRVCLVSMGQWRMVQKNILASNQSATVSIVLGLLGIMQRTPLIVTRFPRITSDFFREKCGLNREFTAKVLGHDWWEEQPPFEIEIVQGDEELYVVNGLADFAVCHVESGKTLENHGLWVVEEICASHLILIASSVSRDSESYVDIFVRYLL